MRKYLLLLAGLLVFANYSADAEVYKTKDKQGRTVYTDQPAASDTKAKVVDLPNINELPSVSPTTVTDTSSSVPDVNYQVDIISPESGARLQANERTFSVSVSIDQNLKPEHFFAYFLNGEKVNETTDQTITINEPPRGENKVFVEVVDKYGKILGQSTSVTIFVFRPIIKR